MQTYNIYLISGLGADRRLFSKLTFPVHCNLSHIASIPPVREETISSYAKRLSVVIDSNKPFYIIGLSFGGMVATEIAKFLKPKLTIIISSASSAKEIPWYYKLAGALQLPRLIPASALKYSNSFTNWFFGAETLEEKILLKNVLEDTDSIFLSWALAAITSWRNTIRPENLYHVHGAADKILPRRFVDADAIVPDGEHMMVYSKAAVLTHILSQKLSLSTEGSL